ncbi:JAB domain-containing protein, partial [Escherichia coli]|uniref:JAB domain-containing protein n=1 Tax=Escherichia coli TaxID=562 RepID=UPI002AF6A6AD
SSKADRLITERLVQALGLVDIRVPDHLIPWAPVVTFIWLFIRRPKRKSKPPE